jgi:hypothetical protein
VANRRKSNCGWLATVYSGTLACVDVGIFEKECRKRLPNFPRSTWLRWWRVIDEAASLKIDYATAVPLH